MLERVKETTRTMRWGTTGTAAGAMALALVMVLSPLAAGAHTYKAPYSGMVTSPYQYSDQSGCASLTVTSPMNWSSTTGVASYAAKTTAKSCPTQIGPVGGDSFAYTDSETALALPLKMTNGVHNITANWKLNPIISDTFKGGNCTGSTSVTYFYCEEFSDYDVYTFAELYDNTNGTYIPMTCCNYYYENYAEVYNETEWDNFSGTGTWYNYSGNYSYISPNSGALQFNTTWSLVRSDAYYLIMYVEFDVESDCYSYDATLVGGSVTDSISAVGSHAAVLSSVVVV